MRRALVAVAVVAASAYVIAYGLDPSQPGGVPAHDVYAYFYPNILHALRSLAAGGQGLLWNPFQNCGQPFFAVSSVGLLYPPNLLFLVLDPRTALRVVLFTNLLIGGFGAYGLGREIGGSPVGALGGALAFVLASSTFHLTTWMPTVQGPYVWMPAAMWCCERLVKAPSLRGALLLALVLAVSLLPGHPQFTLFTCQLIALRLLWSLLDQSERRHLPRALGGVALAVVVMLLLVAAQLLPGLEVAAESLRSASLRAEEVAPRGSLTLADIALNMHSHSSLAPFTIVPGFIAAAAIVSSAHRRVVLFYALSGVLFLALSLGLLYQATPFAHLFRMPMRFMFITGFCVAVLTGQAIDVLARGSWAALATAAVALAALHVWVGSWPIDWMLAAVVLGGGLLGVVAPVAQPVAALVIVAAVAFAPVMEPHWTTQRYLADDGPLYAHADVLERVRGHLTPHDRVHLAAPLNDPGFEHKTAGLFAVRGITDLEPQQTRRYAEFITMLQKGQVLWSLNQLYYPGLWNGRTVRWPLVNLAAVRYLVIDKSLDEDLAASAHPQLTAVDGDETLRVYENPDALPRAYYVPQIAVVPDADARLKRLAAGREDRRRLALVDTPPGSGFLGVTGNAATADARFVVDDPEHVVLEVVAPERGFLFLADQHFPGWSATVNGQPAPILVGNHAFRLVEVPQGPVTVEFRYRPRRVWIGALISTVTLLAVAIMLMSTVRRDESGHPRTRSQ